MLIQKKETNHVRNKQSLKLFLILILCSTYIFSFSHLGAFAYDTLFNKIGSFEKGTMLGNADLSGQSKSKASTLLNEKWTNWQNGTTITFHYKEKTEVFDNTLFTLLEEESLNRVKEGQRNELVVRLDSLDTFLSFISPTLTAHKLDIEKLKNNLLSKAESLDTGNVDIHLEDYWINPAEEQKNIVGEAVIKTNLSFNEMNVINEQLHEMKLASMKQYSLLTSVKEVGLQLSPEALSSIATGIYQVILPTNFSIIERNISEELPDYAELGFEAKVNPEANKDLVFMNGNESSYKIRIKAEKDRLVVSLLGPSFLQQYKIITQDQQSFTPKTIVQFNPELSPAQKIVEKEGKEGQFIKVVRKIYTENNELIQEESISEDFYPPVHRVEVHGLIVSDTTSNNKATDTQTSSTTAADAATGTSDSTNADHNPSASNEADNKSNAGSNSGKSTQ